MFMLMNFLNNYSILFFFNYVATESNLKNANLIYRKLRVCSPIIEKYQNFPHREYSIWESFKSFFFSFFESFTIVLRGGTLQNNSSMSNQQCDVGDITKPCFITSFFPDVLDDELV